eukprot:g5661.t1
MQVILNCDTYDNGCHGGDPLTAYRYIHENGIPEETCQLYEATGRDVGNTCTSMDICMNCSPGKGCVAQDRYDTYRVDEYGLVNGTFWGEDGWFRIVRGENNLGIEGNCQFATPLKNVETGGFAFPVTSNQTDVVDAS